MNWFVNVFFRLLGFSCIGYCFYMVIFMSKSYKPTVFHFPSALFIFGTLTGLILISYQISFLLRLIKSLLFLPPSKIETQILALNEKLTVMTDDYYKSGARGIQSKYDVKKLPKLWQLLLNQLEAKIPIGDVRSLIQYDAGRTKDHLSRQIRALGFLSAISPSIGLLGTVLGLIKLLANLSDLSSLGSNMALALVTTLYGIFISVLVFNPLMSRLQGLQSQVMKSYQQVFFWLNLIEARKPSFYCHPHFWNSLDYHKEKQAS